MDDLLGRLPGDPVANAAAVGVVALALLDFILGTVRAISNATWVPEAAATWVRMQLLGQVVPIILVLTFGQIIGTIRVGDFEFNVLVVGALTAAASYTITTAKSVMDSLSPSKPDVVPPDAT